MTVTVAQFYDNLAALTVAGIARAYAFEPNGINTADLPAQWVRLPQSGAGAGTAFASACVDTSKERAAELVIAVEAAGQETPAANTATILELMDNIETALDTWTSGPAFVDYTMEAGQVTAGGVPYWGIVVNVSGRG